MTYTYEGVRGWRGVRFLRPFRGMYHDVRRRLPYYWSDIKDAWDYRTIASIVRMYFVKYAIHTTLIKATRLGAGLLTVYQHPARYRLHDGHVPSHGRVLWHQ